MSKMKTVNCISCYKIVEVSLVPWHDGYFLAVCPICKKLAYNGKK